MVRLFRASARKLQWDRGLHYSHLLRRPSLPVCCTVSAALLCLAAVTFTSNRPASVVSQQQQSPNIRAGSRQLLATEASDVNATYYDKYCNRINSSSKSGHISWESCDFEKSTQHIAGWVTLYIIITLVIFVALAIVCDDFFVPSLEAISEKLSLSEDVAGATFMAAGSSAPELFSSIAAVTFDSDAGVGTIAGSAVFNLLVIISLTAAFAGKVLHLDWRPLTRDAVWYMVSIVYFIVMVSDSLIQIWEPIVLLVLYAIYIVIMVLNPTLMEKLALLEQKCCCSRVSPSEDGEASANGAAGGAASQVSMRSDSGRQFHHNRRNSVLLNLHGSRSSLRSGDDAAGEAGGGRKATQISNGGRKAEVSTHSVVLSYSEFNKTNPALKEEDENGTAGAAAKQEGDEEEKKEEEEQARMECPCKYWPDIRGAPPQREEEMNCGRWTLFVLKWIIFVVAFPFLCLFSWTIPECSRPDLKKFFMVSFIVSVLWIAGLSFAMVTAVARMGCLLGVDTFVMSLVVLAAGTSIPDLLSSIIVARDGYGDMAVSNAIGSNVFDIDLGLGLPFLIRLCISAADPLDMFSDKERRAWCEGTMYAVPHMKFGFILGGLLILCMTVMVVVKFRLGKIVGVSFFLMYILFLTYAFVQEFACTYNC